MCTAISFSGFFGRTLDYERGFGEEVTALPCGSVLEMRHRDKIVTRYKVMGMARVEGGYPLFFDAVNSEGLGMAGLNFTSSARYFGAHEGDIASFELIPYILSQGESVRTAVKLLEGVNICDTPFSGELPPSLLHWMIADRKEAVVVESTAEGLNIYPAHTGVLTNEPPYPYQMMNLRGYINLSPLPAVNRFSSALDLEPYSRGMGAVGLPGDWSSASRFVRASFVTQNAEKINNADGFFDIMSTVSVPKGCMILESGEAEYTRYISCMDLTRGEYLCKRRA